MTKGEIIWAVCGVIALFICIAIAVQKKRWKWFFIISWPVIAVLGPIGLIMIIGEWYGNRPYRKITTDDV